MDQNAKLDWIISKRPLNGIQLIARLLDLLDLQAPPGVHDVAARPIGLRFPEVIQFVGRLHYVPDLEVVAGAHDFAELRIPVEHGRHELDAICRSW